jgi:hypothetical protein
VKFIFSFDEYLKEGLLAVGKSKIEFEYKINAYEHFYDRLSRDDNEDDINGSSIIEEYEVISDMEKAITKIAKKNLFNNGIYWNDNKLNKEILIQNIDTNLNIITVVDKIKTSNDYEYIFTIKTVMRKNNFQSSSKENSFKIQINGK